MFYIISNTWTLSAQFVFEFEALNKQFTVLWINKYWISSSRIFPICTQYSDEMLGKLAATNHRPHQSTRTNIASFKDRHRFDDLNSNEYFPNEVSFYPEHNKKFSTYHHHSYPPTNLYRHIYPTTKVQKRPSQDAQEKYGMSWLDKLNPFHCEEDESEDYEDDEPWVVELLVKLITIMLKAFIPFACMFTSTSPKRSIYFREFDLGDELFERRKFKLLKHKLLLKKKKKKKKILLKILLKIFFIVAVVFAAHILYKKYVTTVRRLTKFKFAWLFLAK